MTELVLDGRTMRSLADLHAQVADHPRTPDWYGPSLDALFDLLVALYPKPVHVRWHGAGSAREAMGGDFARAVRVFEDAVAYSRERGTQGSFALLEDVDPA